MNVEEMHALHLVELGFLQDAMGQLNYSSRIATRSTAVPYHTLLVELPPDSGSRQRQLALNFYPIDDAEFAGSLFLQYFIVFPFQIAEASSRDLAVVLHLVNSKVVLGHFGLSDDGDQLHFRYVQAIDSDDIIDSDTVRDVVTLVSNTPVLFEDLLEEVATGHQTLDAALAKVRSIYSEPPQ